MTETAVREVQGELAPPSSSQGLLEVFRRRYLLRLLVKREISARYEGSFLGLVWSYINPVSQFFIYWFFMGHVMGASHGVDNYPVHVFAGIIVVHFFTETFGAGTRSIVRNKSLVVKMAMPREMFPVAAMLVSLYHVMPQLLILTGVCIASGWTPDATGVLSAVLAVLIAMVLGTALALFFSVANVFFRDFGSFVGILTNYVRFSVPMIYGFTMVTERLGPRMEEIYLANPISVAVLLIQRCFWVGTTDDPSAAAATMPDHLIERGLAVLAASLVVLVIAQLHFSRFENKIPERI